MEKVRIGIIGCGGIANGKHLPALQKVKEAELVAFCDIIEEKAVKAAKEYGTPDAKVYTDYKELLKDESIDAVHVLTPNRSHSFISIDAMRAGKHVMCEKPMAVTYEECEAMTKAAEESGKYLMIGQNQRLTKAHVKAKEMIREGLIGKVLTFRTTFGHGGPETWSIDPGKKTWFFDKKRAAMGAMADLGIHKTDLIQYLISSPWIQSCCRLI